VEDIAEVLEEALLWPVAHEWVFPTEKLVH
jgi:hypothetical protein